MCSGSHLLHVFPTFRLAGAQTRVVAIINHLGRRIRHSIVTFDGDTSAVARIDPSIRVDILPVAERGLLRGPLQFRDMFRELRPHLLLTYNWGAMDAVLAAQMGGGIPVIHAEDGFGPDEAVSLKKRRVWMRRLLLPRVYSTVVPSLRLREIALGQYKLREDKVSYIPNGVDPVRFAPGDGSAMRARLGIPADALVFGYTGRLSAEKNLAMAMGALCAAAPSAWALIVGDGGTRAELEQRARQLGMGGRVVFPGAVEDTAPYYAAMDVFLMSSTTEQMPIAMIEAMAAGLPVVATRVGDSAAIAGEAGALTMVDSGDEHAYRHAVGLLAGDVALRRSMGAANRERAVQCYSLECMLAAYDELYEGALGISPAGERAIDAKE